MNFLKFRTTTHPTRPARLGRPVDWDTMELLIDTPGTVEVQTVATEWAAPLSGLLNLKDPKPIAAGFQNRKEPIKIYMHIIRHPEKGFFLVDTGVSKRLVEDPSGVGVGWVLRKYGGINDMNAQPSTEDVIAAEGAPLAGVFLTHIHLDHVTGLPAVPQETPIYIGKKEANARLFLNMMAQGTNNRMLAGRPPLEELPFCKNPDGSLSGVVDVFGDGSFFAIPTPGHTIGHVSFLARTKTGAVLFAADVTHTRWGWDNGVEPGTYLADRETSRQSLKTLKALSERHPNMIVKLGHQD
jgi:N-acyl homoserine lactone hydrolase